MDFSGQLYEGSDLPRVAGTYSDEVLDVSYARISLDDFQLHVLLKDGEELTGTLQNALIEELPDAQELHLQGHYQGQELQIMILCQPHRFEGSIFTFRAVYSGYGERSGRVLSTTLMRPYQVDSDTAGVQSVSGGFEVGDFPFALAALAVHLGWLLAVIDAADLV